MTTAIQSIDANTSALMVNGVEALRMAPGGLLNINGGQVAGLRNKIHNGNFLVNQRAVSGTVTAGAGATAHDRWKAGAAGCTYTFSTTNNITTITISAGSLQHVIEGNNLTSGTYVLTWIGTAQGKIGAGAFSASGVTGAVTGGVNLTVEFGTGTLSLVQLEFGVVGTPFEHRPYSIELILCQRYLPAFNGTSTVDDVAWGGTTTTSAATLGYQFLVEPRVPPTGLLVNNVANFTLTTMTAASVVTSIGWAGSSRRIARLSAAGTGTPYGVNNPAILVGSTIGAQLLFTGCEL